MNPQDSSTPSAQAEDSGPGAGTAEATGPLAEAKTKIIQTARETTSRVKAAASSTAARAKNEARAAVSVRKDAAAEKIDRSASALRDSAQSIEKTDPNIAWFTDQAAAKLQGVADYLRQGDFDSLRADCENVARRHPALFFGGLFVAGLVIGNFAKATGRKSRTQREDPEQHQAGMDDGGTSLEAGYADEEIGLPGGTAS